MRLKDSLAKMMRLITFRISKEELAGLNRKDLYLGLFVTWIVGIGRYWDDPKADIPQYLGLGSVGYIFVLSGFLWLIMKPFRISDWRYERVLTFVSLTALPAIFYAIPVEMYFDIPTSAKINAYFLLVVATWRVALLMFFLMRSCDLSIARMIVGTFLPLTFIVSLLTVLNLERAVFNLMGGLRNTTSKDMAYGVLFALTFYSMILFIPLLLAYIALIQRDNRK